MKKLMQKIASYEVMVRKAAAGVADYEEAAKLLGAFVDSDEQDLDEKFGAIVEAKDLDTESAEGQKLVQAYDLLFERIKKIQQCDLMTVDKAMQVLKINPAVINSYSVNDVDNQIQFLKSKIKDQEWDPVNAELEKAGQLVSDYLRSEIELRKKKVLR